MPVLIALAGFVVFLCVFGMRGLMIAGAVFGVAVVVIVGALAWSGHVETVRHQQRDAELAAEQRVVTAWQQRLQAGADRNDPLNWFPVGK